MVDSPQLQPFSFQDSPAAIYRSPWGAQASTRVLFVPRNIVT